MNEQDLQNLIRMKLSELNILNFRNNTGMGWAGRAEKIYSSGIITAKKGDVLVRNARPLHAGLYEGSSDIIGIQPVLITQDMVGTIIGQFIAPEVKTKAGRVSDKQLQFIKNVTKAGGKAGIVRSLDDVVELVGC